MQWETFVKDIKVKLGGYYTDEELTTFLETPGPVFTPYEIRHHLQKLLYPNSIGKIQDFLSTPENPVDFDEMMDFWFKHLSIKDRFIFKTMELS